MGDRLCNACETGCTLPCDCNCHSLMDRLAQATKLEHELHATILQLQAERDTFQEDAAHKEMDAFNLSQRLETVQQQRDRLAEGLQKYGHHLRTSDGQVQCANGCQCGLAALLPPREGGT